MNKDTEQEKQAIDRETKIMLLKALKNGFFTQSDIELLREKYIKVDTVFIRYE
jgi:hypothetical protein